MNNLLVLLASAIVPTITGFIWYNPKVFGNAWMKAADMSEEKIKGANLAVIFGVSLLLSFLLAFSLAPIVIHQFGVMGMLEGAMRPESPTAAEATALFNSLMETYGSNHRHFGHGALHGAMTALFLVLPVMGTNALFERKGFKYIAINAGYWMLTLALMGGIVCQFFQFPM
jgi:hypothetical protein